MHIPDNLTNSEIRAILERKPTLSDLKAIAKQRSIYLKKGKTLRESIVENLTRQEGYEKTL